MISYAQNFEDVMLSRALGRVEAGFYIDVGAADPSLQSVTRAFYDRGWRGINIEPLPQHVAALTEARPRDITLGCAAGSRAGTLRLWETDVVGWATARTDVIERLMADGHRGTYLPVETRTLQDICAEHAPADIHFLKIDVEGLERDVLLGCDFSRFRPWIVVIEATRPNSTEETHGEWEDILLAAEYRPVYADGLNRFYLAGEHGDLADAFRYPPNVFDDFETYAKVLADAAAQRSRSEAEEADARTREAEQDAHRAKAAAEEVSAWARRCIDDAEARTRRAGEIAAAAEAEARRQEDFARWQERLARDAEARTLEAEARALDAVALAGEAEDKRRAFEDWAHWAEERARRAEARAATVEGEIAELLASKSWRLTLPLREARLHLRGLARRCEFWHRRLAQAPAAIAFDLARRPAVAAQVRRMARRLGVEESLRAAYRAVVGHSAAGRAAPADRPISGEGGAADLADAAPMTRHARAIYLALRSVKAGKDGRP